MLPLGRRLLSLSAATLLVLGAGGCTDSDSSSGAPPDPATPETGRNLDLRAAYAAADPWAVIEAADAAGLSRTAPVADLNAGLDLPDGVEVLEADLGSKLPRLCVTGPDRSIAMVTERDGDVAHYAGPSGACAGSGSDYLALATLDRGPNGTLAASYDSSANTALGSEDEISALMDVLNGVAEKNSAGGRDAALLSDVERVAAALEDYRADHPTYPRTAADLTLPPLAAGNDVELAVTGEGAAYCLRGHHDRSSYPEAGPIFYPSDEGEPAQVATGACKDDETLPFRPIRRG